MLLRLICLLCACAGSVALQAGAPARPAITRAAAAPIMQFRNSFAKKEEEPPAPAPKRGSTRGGRSGKNFYDDEQDTVSRPDWIPNFVEQGENEDGQIVDLATEGAGLYVAFIPFLLLWFAYTNGVFSFGYANGNF